MNIISKRSIICKTTYLIYETATHIGEPVLKGPGFVCPLYVRHKNEASLTTSIVYPLTRCLYGRRVRQPNAGDFGIKGSLVEGLLNSPLWTESTRHFGVDIWMTTAALNARVPICQSFMASPKIHRIKDPYAHLSVLFRQVVGTIFDMMSVYPAFWTQVKWSKPTILFGMDTQDVETPIPVDVNIQRLHERFLQGFDQYHDTRQGVYDQTVMHKLQEITKSRTAAFLPSHPNVGAHSGHRRLPGAESCRSGDAPQRRP